MKLACALDEIGHQRTLLRIRSTREISFRLVQENVCILSRLDLKIDQFAADFDVIGFGIGFCTEHRDLAVHGHDTLGYQLFRGTAGSDPGLGD